MRGLSAELPSGHPGKVAGPPARRCPRCWSERLRPVTSGASTQLFCTGCHRCWRLEDGYLVEVNPYACPGCADRGLCLGR